MIGKFVYCILSVIVLFTHNIHLSEVAIDIRNSEKVFIETKIFYDDLQMAMGLVPGEELPENYTNADSLINIFLQKHLQIKVNKEPINWKYISSTAANQTVWTELSILPHETITSIEIINTILTQAFNDQRNLVKIKDKNGEKKYLLNANKTSLIWD